MSTPACLVYVTCPDESSAEAIARHCVESKLAACANILPKMRSIYCWKGQVEADNESVLILKAIKANFPSLTKAIKKLHPYEVPCILQLPIDAGEANYLAWLGAK